MSLETLREAILAQARREADELTAQAQQQTEAEERRIMQRAGELEEDIVRTGEREGIQRAQQMHQQAELVGRAGVLRAKEEEIEKTKQVLLEQILEEDPAPLIKALLELIPDEDGKIIPGEKHAATVKKAAHGKNVASKAIPHDGGFIFEGETTELNVTVSNLVDHILKKHRAAIASVLFG